MKYSAKNVYAVILAGGNGERFWPLSTPEKPKQFLELFDGKPLIRHSVDRVSAFIPPERILIITGCKLTKMTRRALPMLPKANIVGEPCRRDTAAAMATALALVKRRGGNDAIACVLTSDHIIRPESKFRRVLADAARVAFSNSSIITIGIPPVYPATGFGYIECGQRLVGGSQTQFCRVRRFVEKPDAVNARKYFKRGNFLWNSGMFIWRVGILEQLFHQHAPDFTKLIDEVCAARSVSSALNRLYPNLRRISFDYAVMEKTSDILVARGNFEWDDVGSWEALANYFPADRQQNVKLGNVQVLDSVNSVIVSDNHRVALFGVNNLVVVHTPKATLICAKDRVQELKRLVAEVNRNA